MGSSNTGHFSAFNKEVAGYLASSQILTVSAGGEYTLDRYETPSDGYKALKIPLGSGFAYYLEYRTPQGYDGNLLQGVYLRLAMPRIAEPRWGSSAGLIGTLQPLEGSEPFLLRVGKGFSDPQRGVSIEVVADDGSRARVRVMNPPRAVPAQPQEALALENKNPIMVDTLLPIRKGQQNTMLLDFTVGTTGTSSRPVRLESIRVICHSVTGLVFTALRVSRNGVQVGPTVTPVARSSTNDFVANFDLGASNLMIDPSQTLRLVISGDVGVDFTVDYYSIVLIENVLGSRLESDGTQTPVRNAWNVFSGKLTVVP
jgi:hypothetical protein